MPKIGEIVHYIDIKGLHKPAIVLETNTEDRGGVKQELVVVKVFNRHGEHTATCIKDEAQKIATSWHEVH